MIKYCIYFGTILFLALASCAKQGAPTGGIKDVYPPKFLGSSPDTLSKNVPVNIKEIRIDFDEYIVLKESQKQILISPPLKSTPNIVPTQNSPRKYISIIFKDTLKANTTYNINFGESIQDNTEGNKLTNFSYVFSTGNILDSLMISGKITRSLSDDIKLKTLVALYKKDSLPIDLNKKPYYISKIDSLGNYNLKYLHPGNYQLLAFNDENTNTKFDGKEEEFGFISTIVNLKSNQVHNLVLSKQKERYKIVSAKQEGQGKIIFTTSGKPDSLIIKPLYEGFPKKFHQSHIPQSNSTIIWFNTKEATFEDKNQRLKFVVENKTQKDTLSTLYDSKKETKLIISNLSKEMVSGEFVTFNFNNYIEKWDAQKITVLKDKDTLTYAPEFKKDNPTEFNIRFPIEFEKKYTINILPAAFTDFLGNNNDSLVYSFITKAKNEYGNLRLKINNKPTKPFIIELLQKNTVIKEIYGNNDTVEFNNLLPNNYSFRILVDENENGRWDSGDFKTNTQPEKTYSSPNVVTIRAFWDINESWTLVDN